MDKDLVIVGLQRKGNVIRFQLGKHTEEWGWINPNYKDYNGVFPDYLNKEHYKTCLPYGDDWDDPFDNAGPVYDEFVYDHYDVAFPYDFSIFTLENYDYNSRYSSGVWSEEALMNRKTPALIIVRPEDMESDFAGDYNTWVGNDKVHKYYYRDIIDEYLQKFKI